MLEVTFSVSDVTSIKFVDGSYHQLNFLTIKKAWSFNGYLFKTNIIKQTYLFTLGTRFR